MATIDLEAEYNNRRRVPEHVEIMARWTAESLHTRDRLSPYKELTYGPSERHRYDLFETQRRGHSTPLVVYIHGGYWQRGDRKDFSFVVRELVAAGIDVAVPSYTLAPAASIRQIIDEMRRCLTVLWQRHGRHPVVVGHSAGGHLAAALLATDWSKTPGVPDDLVRRAYAISGVFELEPLIPTSINEALRLDADDRAR
jgi:arylformamidase